MHSEHSDTNSEHSDPNSFWGDPIWKTTHILAACLNKNNAKLFLKYLYDLPDLLPCKSCGRHLSFKLTKIPPEPYMTNKHDALLYTYFLHDSVNLDINKEVGKTVKISPNYEDFKMKMFNSLENHCKECKLDLV